MFEILSPSNTTKEMEERDLVQQERDRAFTQLQELGIDPNTVRL